MRGALGIALGLWAGLVLAPAAARCGDHGPATLRIEAPGPPAATYSTAGPLTAGQRRLQGLLRDAGLPLALDAGLCRAAHAYAMALSPKSRQQPPMAAVEFLIHRSGCPDATASATVAYTTEEGDGEVLSQLRALLRQPGLSGSTHVGLARTRAVTPPYRWRWGIFLVTRRFSLRGVPLATHRGRELPMQVRLGQGLRSPEVLVLRPGEPVRSLPVGFHGHTLTAVVDTGSRKGVVWIEVVAEGPHGPEVVALFPVWVDRPVPSLWEGPAAPTEGWVHTPRQAERYLFTLVNRDRRAHGLPPLLQDDALTEIARAHSQDMARVGYFGHRSPSRGGLPERLQAAGYRSLWAAENVARAGSMQEAEEALMRSPGHRANILAPEATHLGVGVASGSGEDHWLVTQVFSRPAPELDMEGWREALRRRLDAERLRRGRTVLVWSPDLAAAAAELAPLAAAGQDTGSSLVARAKASLTRRGRVPPRLLVQTALLWSPDQMPIPEPELDGARSAGLGIALPRRSSQPVAVVLLLSRP